MFSLRSYNTPVRTADQLSNSNELLINYYDQWVTQSELDVILENDLVPKDGENMETTVEWVTPSNSTTVLSPEQFAKKAFMDAVEAYSFLFVANGEFRKTKLARIVLQNYIQYNPTAIGMSTRREYVLERRVFARSYKHYGPENPVNSVQLFQDILRGTGSIKFSNKFVPDHRTGFKDYQEAAVYARAFLGSKIVEGHQLPSLETMKEA
eukprot:TRINITY_DN5678_c0_g1_i2.p1 TRINITY_DN5678_c0_g1~~TRINITY_DN5678_c0_g1_i2.p1  ORF type:complete len:209 (+),score=60.17 TRINITY_DN5678_c0_g1_i2:148-774(+)